ncbi:MAG: thiamine pyrophosphate-binding protein [Pirellulales bacterium]
MMFTGAEIVAELTSLGATDVVWLPDSEIGPWESALVAAADLRLIRVCREGEAWPLAAGLHLGGRRPVVVMQTTGLFESGDAMRNVLFDLKLPLLAIVGHRSYLVPDSPDTACHFAEPILRAWGIDYRLIASAADKPTLAEHLRGCISANKPGVVLMAEGRM